MNASCKDCAKRHIGCHSDCEDYSRWLEQYHINKRKFKYDIATTYITENKLTNKRRF